MFVIVGDGEINEGSFWETSMMASKHKANNFHVIVDYNKIQSYGITKELWIWPLKEKLKHFGYKVAELNGHDVNKLTKYFKNIKFNKNKPTALICHTVKAKFSFWKIILIGIIKIFYRKRKNWVLLFERKNKWDKCALQFELAKKNKVVFIGSFRSSFIWF